MHVDSFYLQYIHIFFLEKSLVVGKKYKKEQLCFGSERTRSCDLLWFRLGVRTSFFHFNSLDLQLFLGNHTNKHNNDI